MWLLLIHVPVLFAGACAPHSPIAQFRDHAGAPPSWTFPLGTDDVGRDVASRVLHGARVSLAAAALATAVAMAGAVAVGALALGGAAWDRVAGLATEATMAVPWVFLLLGVRSALPVDLAPVSAFLAVSVLVGAVSWGPSAQIVRSVVLDVAASDYVAAARATGARGSHLLLVHVVPALRPRLVAQALVALPQFIVAETALSFLGLGIPEPWPSLGVLLGEMRSSLVLAGQPWRSAPAVILCAFVLTYNLVAESTRGDRAFDR